MDFFLETTVIVNWHILLGLIILEITCLLIGVKIGERNEVWRKRQKEGE